MVEIELKSDGFYVNNVKHRWYKLWNYPALIVASYIFQGMGNLYRFYKR